MEYSMQGFVMRWVSTSLLLILPLLTKAASAQEDALRYQDRGNRAEGIKAKPVAGNSIELLAATIHDPENAVTPRDDLALAFFLDPSASPDSPKITVREIEYRTYYWLDRVTPASSWQPGATNVFRWSTQEVVSHLPRLQLANLGALVRLGDYPAPSSNERVAPADLSGSGRFAGSGPLLFTFRTRDHAKLTAAIYPEGSDTAVHRQEFPGQPGGRAFTVRWNPASSRAAPGRYRLRLSGYFTDTNDPIQQTVDFYYAGSK